MMKEIGKKLEDIELPK